MKANRRVTHPIRMHIDMSQDAQTRYWTKHLNVTRDDLQRAIDKVGNSAAAVRKQLASSRQNPSTAGQ